MSAALAFPEVAGELALLLLRATLLMGAAWAAAAALRKIGASAAARHIAWLTCIGGLLALPILWWLVPAVGLPILPAEAASAAGEWSPAMASPPPDAAGPVSPDLPFQPGWGILLAMGYAIGASTLLLRLVVGRRTLKRLWSDSGAVQDPAWEKSLSRLSAGMGLTRRVELRISRGPAVPMTWGTFSPKLLLPAEASEWSPERRRLVLLHELAHVARRDSFSRSLASLACAFYWFHPGAWFAARQLRMEQEHAADDRVLTAGGSAQAYALNLLHLARGAAARPKFDQAAAMAGMYQLERRLVSITGPARRNSPGAFFLTSSALLGTCTTLLVAAAVPVSATSTLPRSLQAERTDPSPRPAREASIVQAELLPAVEPGVGPEPARRSERTGETASPSRSAGAAPEAMDVERRVMAGRQPVPAESAPTRQDGRDAQTLANYGWELPRRDPRLEIASSSDPLRPIPLLSPDPRESGSSQRIGRPKWARKVPRIVQGAKPMNSPGSTTQGPLMLSWSLGGVGD
ncbi:MAG TPA: M56 family metallopeptidase [Allosphingosinicella sp.]